jgi:DNA polymerase-4
LKLKFNDFEVLNRSHSLQHYTSKKDEIELISMDLIKNELPAKKGIRLIGLTLSNLNTEFNASTLQLTLDF